MYPLVWYGMVYLTSTCEQRTQHSETTIYIGIAQTFTAGAPYTSQTKTEPEHCHIYLCRRFVSPSNYEPLSSGVHRILVGTPTLPYLSNMGTQYPWYRKNIKFRERAMPTDDNLRVVQRRIGSPVTRKTSLKALILIELEFTCSAYGLPRTINPTCCYK